MQKIIIFISILLTFSIFFARNINATTSYYNISVSGTIPQTQVTFSGFAPPSLLIYITENGSVLATTTSNNNGLFSYSIININPGIHEYSLYFEDQNGQNSSSVDIFDNVENHYDNIISNINLSPTISWSKTSVGFDISGYAYQSSKIELFVNGVQEYLVDVSNSGYWNYTIPYSALSNGNYEISGLDITSTGILSNLSNTLFFTVSVVKNIHNAPSSSIGISNIHSNIINHSTISIKNIKISPVITQKTPIINRSLYSTRDKNFVINTVKSGFIIIALYSILFLFIFVI